MNGSERNISIKVLFFSFPEVQNIKCKLCFNHRLLIYF